jgi:hypothetical protein
MSHPHSHHHCSTNPPTTITITFNTTKHPYIGWSKVIPLGVGTLTRHFAVAWCSWNPKPVPIQVQVQVLPRPNPKSLSCTPGTGGKEKYNQLHCPWYTRLNSRFPATTNYPLFINQFINLHTIGNSKSSKTSVSRSRNNNKDDKPTCTVTGNSYI